MTSFPQSLSKSIDFLNILYVYEYTYVQCVPSSIQFQSFLYYKLIIILVVIFTQNSIQGRKLSEHTKKNIKHTNLWTSLELKELRKGV